MIGEKSWAKQPDWIDDKREGTRWVDVRTAVAILGEDEYMGKTGDISMEGLRIALQEVRPAPGEALKIAVVFEDGVVEIEGTIRYSIEKPWGAILGVEYNPGQDAAREFLHDRYA